MKMNIKETFLNLTKSTYPHGHEQEMYHLLPEDISFDEFGNPYKLIGEDPNVMFTCHLDTASGYKENVTHIISGDFIMTNGKTILGADDKAGTTILLYMIENNIPGLYYFFLGEERGCVGSRQVASKHLNQKPFPNITKVVSFDRRGHDSVITHQLGGRCCSDIFAKSLAKQLNQINPNFKYGPDPTGIYTDSAQFINVYQECTNISVGYDYEHTTSEQQDIKHLMELCNTVVQVEWNNLPTERKTDSKYWEDDEDDWEYPIRTRTYNIKTISVKDEDFPYENIEFEIEEKTKEILHIQVSKDRQHHEQGLIEELLTSLEIEHHNGKWDGNTYVYKSEYGTDEINREILIDYIKDLDLETKYREYIS